MAAAKKPANKTTKKPVTKKPGYVKQNQGVDDRYRWESGAGVCAVSDLKPIKRGK